MLGQGVCDLRQTRGLEIWVKQFGLLGEADPGLACLTGDVLMTIEHHLGGEPQVTADLNGDVAPIGIQEVRE
jgi:hypothetical protein